MARSGLSTPSPRSLDDAGFTDLKRQCGRRSVCVPSAGCIAREREDEILSLSRSRANLCLVRVLEKIAGRDCQSGPQPCEFDLVFVRLFGHFL